MESGFSFLKTALYQLRQQYGRTVQYYSVSTTGTNYRTGVKNPVRNVYTLKKVVKLPRDRAILIGQAKNYYDKDTLRFIIDGSMYVDANGLKITDDPQAKDYLVIDRGRYTVSEVEILEYNLGFILTTGLVEGSDVDLEVSESVETKLVHTNVASGVKV